MKKVLNKALKWLFVFFMCITTFNFSVLAEGEPLGIEQNGPVTNFSIRWLNTADDTVTIDAIKNNREYSVRAELTFSVSAANIQKGDINIKIPGKLFTNRNSSKQGRIDLNLSNTDYEYEIVNDEVVITNTAPITDGHTLNVQIDYYDATQLNEKPSQIINGSKHKLQATYEVTQDGVTITGCSNVLTAVHNISTDMRSVAVYMDKRLMNWDSTWGDKPADADGYFYIRWRIDGRLSYGSEPNTLPFQLTLSSTNESGQMGDVALWENISYSGRITDRGMNENGDYVIGVAEPLSSGQDKFSGYVVMKYPKSSVAGDNNRLIEEKITATLVPYYKEDGEVKIEKMAKKSYDYEDIDFKYPDGNYGINKTRVPGYTTTDSISGALNKINLIDETEEFELPIGYRNEVTIEAGDLTLENNGDPKNIEDYEKNSYETEVVDDLIVFDDTRLNAEDYSIESVSVSNYKHYSVDPYNEKNPYVTQDVDGMEPIVVYYSTDLTGGNWKKIATVEKISQSPSDQYLITDNNDIKTTTGTLATIKLPDNAVAVKATVKSKRAKIEFNLDVVVNLKGTKKVKELIKDKSRCDLTNISTLVVRDKDDKWVNSHSPATIIGSLAGIVKQRDENVFGSNGYGQHANHTFHLGSVFSDSTMTKTIDSFELASPDGYYKAECKIGATNEIGAFKDVLTETEFRKLGLLEEEKRGKIYDLLPLGATIDENTLKGGYLLKDNNSPFIEEEQFNVTVEYKTNWKNSGRTMAIFTIEAPDGYDNFKYRNYKFIDYFYTGFAVKFDMIYSIDSIADYGSDLRNLSAYQSENELYNGYPDNGQFSSFAADEKEWFTDVDEDGESGERAPSNTLYAVAEGQIRNPISSQVEFSKRVKSQTDVNYKDATEVLPNSNYSYRIRIGNTFNKQNVLQSKGLVLFDVLEEAHKNQSHWKGTLDSVDVTQPTLKGIDAKVYYSTKENIQLDTTMNGELTGDADIKNSSVWSSTMPEDKSKITAIAVDMRYTTNKEEYTLEGSNTSLAIIVNMIAPNENIQEYMNQGFKAYNDAWVASQVKLDNTSVWTGRTLQCLNTEVSIRQPSVRIDKTSDPESGTEQDPTDVQNKDPLTYDVAVTNNEISQTLSNIKVEDTIPAGLTIDFENIKYYYNANKNSAKLISDNDDGISVKKDNKNEQKLTFLIDTLNANNTIHFLIPTTVDETDQEARYENQAFITEIDGTEYNIESQITYHEKKVPQADFEFVKMNKQDEIVSGAQFVLYELNCKDKDHKHIDQLIPVDKNGDINETSECYELVSKQSSPEAGIVSFKDLKTNREYRLIEYQAPEPYVTPEGQWVITYDTEKEKFKVNKLENPPAFEDGDTLILRNYKLEELPSTGGRGWTRYMLIGTAIMFIGGVWIYQNKNRKIRHLKKR